MLGQLVCPVIAEKWSDDSALPEMTVGALAAHLARCLVQVEIFLDAELPLSDPLSAVHFYARLTDTKDVNSQYNQGGRQKSIEAATRGADEIVAELAQTLDRLDTRLPREAADAKVALVKRPDETMLLDEYLRTRCVEIAVHLRDLAVSCNWEPSVPETVEQIAIDIAMEVAQVRHGMGAVLDALYRSERSTGDIFPVL